MKLQPVFSSAMDRAKSCPDTSAMCSNSLHISPAGFFDHLGSISDSIARLLPIAIITLVWCCCPTSSANRNDLMQNKLIQMIQMNNRLFFERQARSNMDLRDHKLFTSDTHLVCCPTVTELVHRKIGVNPQGLVLELFHAANFTQTFYERACHPEIKDRRCQFLDEKYEPASRCVQQFSYVYAMVRTYGNWFEGFRIDYVRVATGCTCQIDQDVINYSEEYGNSV